MTLSLDSKGRLSFLKKERDKLKSKVIIVRGRNKILFLTGKEWDKLVETKELLSLKGRELRRVNRGFYSSVYFSNIDERGRVFIPLSLRSN